MGSAYRKQEISRGLGYLRTDDDKHHLCIKVGRPHKQHLKTCTRVKGPSFAGWRNRIKGSHHHFHLLTPPCHLRVNSHFRIHPNLHLDLGLRRIVCPYLHRNPRHRALLSRRISLQIRTNGNPSLHHPPLLEGSSPL